MKLNRLQSGDNNNYNKTTQLGHGFICATESFNIGSFHLHNGSIPPTGKLKTKLCTEITQQLNMKNVYGNTRLIFIYYSSAYECAPKP